MRKSDPALQVTNVRLISAIYFALLAVIGTTLLDTLFYALGVEEVIPVFQSVLLAAVVAAIFGALFGEKIMHCSRPYQFKAFVWGFVMVLAALPVYNLGLIYLLSHNNAALFANAKLLHYISLFLLSMLYTFILAGLWMAIAAGFASMYLRGHLVYDILRSQNQDRKQHYDLNDFGFAHHHPKGSKNHHRLHH